MTKTHPLVSDDQQSLILAIRLPKYAVLILSFERQHFFLRILKLCYSDHSNE